MSGVGAAAVSGERSKRASLPPVASILSAETHAIQLAIQYIADSDATKHVVYSDSYSSLLQLKTINYQNPVCRKIQHDIHLLAKENKTIELCCIPGHSNIKGNEHADTIAKLATCVPSQLIAVHYKDWFPVIQTTITFKWNSEWKAAKEKMSEVQPDVGKDDRNIKLNRKDEVILSRLKTGHTWLTHNHLMDSVQRGPSPCLFCNDAAITIKHLLISCVAIRVIRANYFQPRHDIKILLTNVFEKY